MSMPTVSFDASVEMKANSIPEVLTLIESLGKKRRLVVVLDEFQDILNLEGSHEALALLRSKIQFQSDIPYKIFHRSYLPHAKAQRRKVILLDRLRLLISRRV